MKRMQCNSVWFEAGPPSLPWPWPRPAADCWKKEINELPRSPNKTPIICAGVAQFVTQDCACLIPLDAASPPGSIPVRKKKKQATANTGEKKEEREGGEKKSRSPKTRLCSNTWRRLRCKRMARIGRFVGRVRWEWIWICFRLLLWFLFMLFRGGEEFSATLFSRWKPSKDNKLIRYFLY